jgi:type VI protein secretion system component VasK
VVRSGIWAAVGVVVLAVCCVGVSHTKTYGDQLAWVAVGAIALAVAVIGGVWWILRGMRIVRGTRRDVMTELARLTADEPEVAQVDSRSVYFTPAMSRFHTPACPFARGKDLAAVSRSDVGERRPCEVCEP